MCVCPSSPSGSSSAVADNPSNEAAAVVADDNPSNEAAAAVADDNPSNEAATAVADNPSNEAAANSSAPALTDCSNLIGGLYGAVDDVCAQDDLPPVLSHAKSFDLPSGHYDVCPRTCPDAKLIVRPGKLVAPPLCSVCGLSRHARGRARARAVGDHAGEERWNGWLPSGDGTVHAEAPRRTHEHELPDPSVGGNGLTESFWWWKWEKC
jgi:hypothetical protein